MNNEDMIIQPACNEQGIARPETPSMKTHTKQTRPYKKIEDDRRVQLLEMVKLIFANMY